MIGQSTEYRAQYTQAASGRDNLVIAIKRIPGGEDDYRINHRGYQHKGHSSRYGYPLFDQTFEYRNGCTVAYRQAKNRQALQRAGQPEFFWGIFSESSLALNKPESGRKAGHQQPKKGAACRKTPRNMLIYRSGKAPASFSMEKAAIYNMTAVRSIRNQCRGFIPKRNKARTKRFQLV